MFLLTSSSRLLGWMFFLLTAFIGLAIVVDHYPINELDVMTSKLVQRYHHPLLDSLMLGISFFGELPYSLLLVLLIALSYFLKGYRKVAYFVLSISLSGLLILAVKSFINRPRPTSAYVRLVEENRYESFPSGHVLSYWLFFGFMIFLMQELKEIKPLWRKRIAWISWLLFLSIPISRIYLGAHWVSDTIGGMLLGLFCLLPLCHFYKKGE